ncbi:hypothetical protein ACGILS_25785 [Streptomyces albidoflavus]|uniref:hypothetical protein n=1 Tax=Streptomyces albidoflavus TaxID=1886 RepID=UPI0037CE7996
MALDTTPVPVKVLDDVFGEPVTVSLTLALDVYTRSIVAFRLNVGSDTKVDVAMVLRDVMMPLPMRPGWGEEMAWPYPGVPAAVVAGFAGYEPAGLPFFAPETLTTDHGSVYKNHHVVEVERLLGCNILPARAMRPTDKQAVERCFGAVRALLFEALLGYTGVDVADRGKDPEADAVVSVGRVEHLIASWVVRVWQNRLLAEHAPPWAPDQRHSPIEPYLCWHELEGQAAQRTYLAPLLRGHYAESDIPPFRSDALGCLMLLASEFLDARSPDAAVGRASKLLVRSGFTRQHVRLLANTPRLSDRMRMVLLTKVEEASPDTSGP